MWLALSLSRSLQIWLTPKDQYQAVVTRKSHYHYSFYKRTKSVAVWKHMDPFDILVLFFFD